MDSTSLTREQAAAVGSNPLAGYSGEAMHILLLEDHADTRDIAARLLRHMGHTVQGFANGEEIASHCDTGEAFDLLVADIGLPGENGVQVLAKLRRQCKPFKAIALTAFAGDADLSQFRAAGFDGCVTKPCTISSLQAEIERLCLRP